MASHQAPPSLGFSRQERWSGLPFPSPTQESEREVAQSCLTLSDPMDRSLPGSSVHGIFQARVLEWGAIAFSTRDYNSHPPRMPVCFPPWEWNRWEKILTGRTENIECQEESTLRSASPSSTGQMGKLTPCKVMKHIRV